MSKTINKRKRKTIPKYSRTKLLGAFPFQFQYTRICTVRDANMCTVNQTNCHINQVSCTQQVLTCYVLKFLSCVVNPLHYCWFLQLNFFQLISLGSSMAQMAHIVTQETTHSDREQKMRKLIMFLQSVLWIVWERTEQQWERASKSTFQNT